MINRWKMLMLSLVVSLGLLVPVATVGAAGIIDQNGICTKNPEATLCKDDTPQTSDSNKIFGKNGILTKAAQIVTIIVGVAAVIMIISGGIQYSISSGDPARLNRAKDSILYALIGILVAMMAQAIIVFVLREVA